MSAKEIIIFGAGRMGEKFVYQHFDEVSISCFWDNKKTGEFLGYPVRRPEVRRDCFIIVVPLAYLEIREQLINMGYREFYDFIPAQIFRKKMAIAYGNCHMGAVKAYLESYKAFDLEYGFYPFPQIQEIKNMKIDFQSILQYCDLFLHQSIRKDNVYGEKYSSNQMLQYVNKSCEVISLPNLYGMPKYLFPQMDMDPKWRIGELCPFFIDCNIVLWLKNGKSKKEIAHYILEGGVYSESEILYMWEKFKVKMREREQEWDIKISDYILDNYKKEKIFSDLNHITSRTAKEIASRLLKYMGYREEIHVELPLLDAMETVVYQDVREALELEFEDNVIRKYSGGCVSLNCHEMNAEEYIDQICRFIKFVEKERIVI